MRHLCRAVLLASITASALPACGQQSAGDRAHLDAMSREHARETPTPSAAAEVAPRQEVVAREVQYGTVDGRPATGYLAHPAATPGGQALPAILLIHEWWGLNDNIRAMARRYAGEGYQVLALDLYGGRAAADPAQARALMGEIMANPARGAEHVRAGTGFLTDAQRAPRVGVVGYCFGGGWALEAALLEPERIHAAVMYYGRPITDPERLAPLRAPLLGLFGAADAGIPVAQVRRMEEILREQGRTVTVQVYDGAGHGFANPSGESYAAGPAEDAWRRTIAFFGAHLRPAR